jgi:fibronectin type 3 domain-containing protein
MTGLVEETTYYFIITTYDDVSLESANLTGFNTTPDITPPPPPTSVTSTKIGGTFINLSWTASISTDIDGYQIYINDTGSSVNYHYLANTTNCYFNHTNLYEETTYYYKIKAFDEVPLFSVFSNMVTATTLDITFPLPPTAFTCSKIGGRFIELSWTNSISADVDGYEIYVNDTGSSTNFHYLASTSSTNCYFNHTGLVEETIYYYKIRAFDEVPLFSVFSNVVFATTLDITPPVPPTGVTAQDPTGHEITLVWTPNSEADIEGYHIYINDTGAGSTGPFHWIGSLVGTYTQYTVTDLIEETTYFFVIVAYDEVPNNSTFSNVAYATTLDVTPPAVPTGLVATAVSGTAIELTWTANTESDLMGYKIYIYYIWANYSIYCFKSCRENYLLFHDKGI